MRTHTCRCGGEQTRTEEAVGNNGNRLITLTCQHCKRQEEELQSRHGKLIRWRQLPAKRHVA